MSVRPIVLWPDTRLKQPCDTVEDVGAVRDLIADMFDTMYDAPGRGLAAPQIGVLARVFVMDAGWKDGARTPLALINPEIVDVSLETAKGPEGCLSIPGVTAEVRRPTCVTMSYTDQGGVQHERVFTGAEAVVAQHEYDHLEGIVHFDRMSPEAGKALKLQYQALA